MGALDPRELRKLVQEALACFRSLGREEILARVSDPRGPFIRCKICVFALDPDGGLLAHPFYKQAMGKNLAHLRDFNGRAFILKLLRTARSRGYGFVEYTWPLSDSDEDSHRMIFFEQAEGIIFCSGIYTEQHGLLEAGKGRFPPHGPEGSGLPS